MLEYSAPLILLTLESAVELIAVGTLLWVLRRHNMDLAEVPVYPYGKAAPFDPHLHQRCLFAVILEMGRFFLVHFVHYTDK